MERARLLISLNKQGQMAALREGLSDVDRLQEQIEKLTEQVTTSSLHTIDTGQGQRCWLYCNLVGHVRHVCPCRRQGVDGCHCFICNRQGSLGQRVSAGKRPRGACQRQQAPPASSEPPLQCSHSGNHQVKKGSHCVGEAGRC